MGHVAACNAKSIGCCITCLAAWLTASTTAVACHFALPCLFKSMLHACCMARQNYATMHCCSPACANMDAFVAGSILLSFQLVVSLRCVIISVSLRALRPYTSGICCSFEVASVCMYGTAAAHWSLDVCVTACIRTNACSVWSHLVA